MENAAIDSPSSQGSRLSGLWCWFVRSCRVLALRSCLVGHSFFCFDRNLIRHSTWCDFYCRVESGSLGHFNAPLRFITHLYCLENIYQALLSIRFCLLARWQASWGSSGLPWSHVAARSASPLASVRINLFTFASFQTAPCRWSPHCRYFESGSVPQQGSNFGSMA